MNRIRHWRLRAFLALIALAAATSASARQLSLDEWLDRELAPYVSKALTTHPRFKDASVRFVVLHNGSPEANVNELALRLRDRLIDKVVDTPGVRVDWQPDRSDLNHGVSRSGLDCTNDEVHYYIGLEVAESASGTLQVAARALDIEEQSWVSGFGLEWRGEMNREQRRALHHPMVDISFRGGRGAPYDATQMDLMAAQLAHDLGCALLRQVSGEYVIHVREQDSPPGDLSQVLSLISNNIAGVSSLQFAATDTEANALMQGEAHAIDGSLYQYWITVTPVSPDSELAPLGVSAYVQLPEKYIAASRPDNAGAGAIEAGDGLVNDLRIVRLSNDRACRSRTVGYRPGPALNSGSDCMALELTTTRDAVVFVLNHQQNNGLVRLDGGECGFRTAARISRADEALRLALPTTLLSGNQWRPESRWQIDPDADTYYAIAVSDSKAARALATHLDRLPRRCSDSVRPGYEGSELEAWLAGLSRTIDRWQPHIDWHAIKVKNVY